MQFVSQDVKNQMTEQEAEISVLREENAELKKKLEGPQKSPANGLMVLPWVLFVLALGIIAWLMFFKPASETFDQEREQPGLVDAEGSFTPVSNLPKEGIIYSLQIGAFKEFALPANGAFENIYQHKQNDNLTRVTLGTFTKLVDAQRFQNELAETGLDFAYIVAFENGQPIGLAKAVKKQKENRPEGEKEP